VKKVDDLNAEAEMVAISVDSPEEMAKMDQLLGGKITLLTDPDLRVIGAFQMQHRMGGATVGNMGYAIVDRNGMVRTAVVDPLFGRNSDEILQVLRGI
jgi:peroxiredoxin